MKSLIRMDMEACIQHLKNLLKTEDKPTDEAVKNVAIWIYRSGFFRAGQVIQFDLKEIDNEAKNEF